jgi:hypothetical protein
MAKKIEIVGAKAKKIEIVDQPKRRIEPAEFAAALGANLAGEKTAGNLDLISLAELGTQLLNRLRSSGGRPALNDATEICRVPLSAEDLKALEKITEQIGQTTGTKPSPGQVASIIVREYLTMTKSEELGVLAGIEYKVKDHLASIATCVPRLAEILSEASALQKGASSLEAAAKEIKGKIDKDIAMVLTLLPPDAP